MRIKIKYVLVLISIILLCAGCDSYETNRPPNIVLIMGDAALFAEAGCTMHAFESEPACFWMHGRFRRPKARN